MKPSRGLCLIIAFVGAGFLSCSGSPTALFEPGTGTFFGTLASNTGTYTVFADADGFAKTVFVSSRSDGNGIVHLPRSDQNLKFEKATGETLELKTSGQYVSFVFNGDNDLEEGLGNGFAAFAFERADLDALELLLPPEAAEGFSEEPPAIADSSACEFGRISLDDTCAVVDQIDIEELSAAITSALLEQGLLPGNYPSISSFYLEKYLGMLIDFCDAWNDYRDTGEDPCA